jgi:conjugative relaxase-like TrwC/TraI family protein
VVPVSQVTIKTGYDVDYYLDQVGADYYLNAEGEPPGVWGGKAAAKLGLAGAADPDMVRALIHHDIGPDGVPLLTSQCGPRYAAKRTYKQVQEAIEKRIRDELGELAAHMPERVRKIRLEERAKNRTKTPYYDTTFSAEKSVSLAHASLRAAAETARQEGRERDAERLEARARAVEAAVMAGADTMAGHMERRGAIIRTGHHSAHSGEFRDAAGFAYLKFLQHTSRSHDPQLHVQVVIKNKAQRADGADEQWRSLDGRPLWAERLGASAYATARMAQELARQGFPLVKRPDGNGWEIGGIEQKTMDAFSRRSAAIAARLAERIAEYTEMYGHAPNRQALFKLRQRVTIETRAAKQKPGKAKQAGSGAQATDAAKELAAWIRRADDEHVQSLDGLPEVVEVYAFEHPEARPADMPDDTERAEVMRAAVAEVQRQNATWTRPKLEWELMRQMPAVPAAADWGGYLSDMADDVLAGRAGTVTVIQVAPVPDVVDVAPLGLRKDGTSIYRPPGEARYVTLEHLNLEEWLLSTSKAAAAQRVSEKAASRALAKTGLDIDQRAAAYGLLTSQRAVSVLVAPAGTGKTYTMAQFAQLWTEQTGARVVGLTLSENAARVMAGEGMSEAHNIARFFAHGVPVRQGDVLVVDEASQVSTVDLARIVNLAYRAGARVILTGDTEQLGPVEAGGMFRLIAAEGERYQLAEVRRFKEAWERDASLQLRGGEMAAWEKYGSRGRVQEGPQDRVYDRAVSWWATDIYEGKTSVLLAGTNEEAARLAGLAREKRIEWGEIPGGREITLRDGNPASRGDLVRARENTGIDAGGQPLANRDVIRITGWTGDGPARHAIAQRQLGRPDPEGRQWSGEFTVPAAYLEEHAELAYAGNVFVAQGRTVDTSHLVVSEGMNRDLLYVGMTRGRESNRAHVVTGPPDPADYSRAERDAYAAAAVERVRELLENGDVDGARAVNPIPPEPEGMRERNTWESVIAAAMERDDALGTATEAMRAAQEWPVHTRHLYEIAEAGWWKDVVPQIDDMVRQRIRWDDYQRYLNDPARPAFLQELRAHEISGRPIADVLDSITATPFDGLRSVAAGLHGRLGKEPAPARGNTDCWADRTPATAPEYVRDSFTELDRRQSELGEQLAAQPPCWALEAWGVPPAGAGKLRDDWMQRAALVQSYRELAGITGEAVAIGPPPSRQAGMSEAFAASARALELPDEAALIKAMGRGELEAQVREYARAEAVAPVDVTAQIGSVDAVRKTYADQAAAARKAQQEAQAEAAGEVARIMEADRGRLQVADAARQEWAEATAVKAEAAEQARAELDRRGPARQDEARPQAVAAEVREVQAEAADVEAEAQAETAAEIDTTEAAPGISRPELEAEPVIGQPAGELTGIDPEALATMATIQGNLADAQAAAEQRAEKEARDWAAIEQAGIDEPVNHAQPQAELEAAARAEVDDADIEI